MITGRSELYESQSVSSSTETEKAEQPYQAYTLIGVCSVAKTAVMFYSTIITVAKNLDLPSQWPMCHG